MNTHTHGQDILGSRVIEANFKFQQWPPVKVMTAPREMIMKLRLCLPQDEDIKWDQVALCVGLT